MCAKALELASPDAEGLVCADISGMSLTTGNENLLLSHIQRLGRWPRHTPQETNQETELNPP